MKQSGLCLAALLLSACAHPLEERAALLPPEMETETETAPVNCAPPARFGGYLFWMEPPAVAPGASVILKPWFTTQPGVMLPVPADCLEEVVLSGPAKLEADGRTVTIYAEAAPGTEVQVNGRVGEADLSGRILVYVEDAQPLVGRWSQPEEACANEGAQPVRELIFRPDGTFSLTWTPFEIYRDYWGTYLFADGLLTLIPEDGNHIPPDARFSGQVELGSGTLRLPTALFGAPAQGATCAAPFRR